MAYIQSTITVTGSNPISGPNLIAMGGLQIIYTGANIAFSGGGGAAGTVNNTYITLSGQVTGISGYIPKFKQGTGLTQSIIFDAGNNIGINVIPNPEHILEISGAVSITNSSNTTNYALEMSGRQLTYLQATIQNLYTGYDASSDFICTNDSGSDVSGYIDMGINSFKYTGQFVGNANDAYLYSNAGDLYIGNVVTGRKVYIFSDHACYQPSNSTIAINNDEVGINNDNPNFTLDVSGSGNFSLGLSTPNVNLLKTTTSQVAPNPNYNSLYMDNFAQRGILSYVNDRGIGKMIQNTFALESIHNFMPNTTTTMSIIGTTATSVGTLSHPVTFADITGAGFCTNFVQASAGNDLAAGMQSATTPYYLTSGITGLGAGFFYAAQLQWPDVSGLYCTATGLNTGIRFFAGLTDAASIVLSCDRPWPTAALVGFQLTRSTGVSGRFDDTYKFVTKANGAAASMNVQETYCPFTTKENIAMYIYGRNDYRAGVYWMIRRIDPWNGQIYSGIFTGQTHDLPRVSAAAQTFLKPTVGFWRVSGAARNMKLKGMYCETV
jgi:hypothetical protein